MQLCVEPGEDERKLQVWGARLWDTCEGASPRGARDQLKGPCVKAVL